MKYNLKKVRMQYGLSAKKFANLCGVSEAYYELYETQKEIPCKYIYALWKKLDNFPIPDDFFYYTSLSLAVNMNYHHMTQVEVADAFGIRQQTISHYISGSPFIMYEWKDRFLKAFDPFIIANECLCQVNGGKTQIEPIEFDMRGNLMRVDKRKEEAIELELARSHRMSKDSMEYAEA